MLDKPIAQAFHKLKDHITTQNVQFIFYNIVFTLRNKIIYFKIYDILFLSLSLTHELYLLLYLFLNFQEYLLIIFLEKYQLKNKLHLVVFYLMVY